MKRDVLDQFVRGLTHRARSALADATPDRVVLSRRYQRVFGRPLDLRHPQTFNEKLYWLSLYYRNIFCRRKADLDIEQTRRQLNEWMCRSAYWNKREWGYKNIAPRIIAERLLADPVDTDPVEYGFHCFGGEPRSGRVRRNRTSNSAM